MAEPTTEVVPGKGTEIKKETPSGEVLEKAWERARPVLQTAAGGALFTSGVILGKTILSRMSMVADFPPGQALAIGSIIGVGGGLVTAGVVTMREPVQKAFEYFKSKPWEKNK